MYSVHENMYTATCRLVGQILPNALYVRNGRLPESWDVSGTRRCRTSFGSVSLDRQFHWSGPYSWPGRRDGHASFLETLHCGETGAGNRDRLDLFPSGIDGPTRSSSSSRKPLSAGIALASASIGASARASPGWAGERSSPTSSNWSSAWPRRILPGARRESMASC